MAMQRIPDCPPSPDGGLFSGCLRKDAPKPRARNGAGPSDMRWNDLFQLGINQASQTFTGQRHSCCGYFVGLVTVFRGDRKWSITGSDRWVDVDGFAGNIEAFLHPNCWTDMVMFDAKSGRYRHRHMHKLSVGRGE